jgi:hypothetical protein
MPNYPIQQDLHNCILHYQNGSTWKQWVKLWSCSPRCATASPCLRFLYHTQRRTTVMRTTMDEWSARRRDLYLTTHYTHNRQPYMPLVRIRSHNLSRRAVPELHLRPCGHCDRQFRSNCGCKLEWIFVNLWTVLSAIQHTSVHSQ